jgi:hypothetical protein
VLVERLDDSAAIGAVPEAGHERGHRTAPQWLVLPR